MDVAGVPPWRESGDDVFNCRRPLRICAPLGFRPSRAMMTGASGHVARAHHWRIVTTESANPVAPAASLLFQAPVFQAVPEVSTSAAAEEIEPKRRRHSSASAEANAPREETAPKRRRRSKKSLTTPTLPIPPHPLRLTQGATRPRSKRVAVGAVQKRRTRPRPPLRTVPTNRIPRHLAVTPRTGKRARPVAAAVAPVPLRPPRPQMRGRPRIRCRR